MYERLGCPGVVGGSAVNRVTEGRGVDTPLGDRGSISIHEVWIFCMFVAASRRDKTEGPDEGSAVQGEVVCSVFGLGGGGARDCVPDDSPSIGSRLRPIAGVVEMRPDGVGYSLSPRY